jgi:hypothetical protein
MHNIHKPDNLCTKEKKFSMSNITSNQWTFFLKYAGEPHIIRCKRSIKHKTRPTPSKLNIVCATKSFSDLEKEKSPSQSPKSVRFVCLTPKNI